MKLVNLSTASIIACLMGLVALLGGALFSLAQMQAKQAEIAELIDLQKRIDDFSVASDSLLLFNPDPGLWRAYRANAQAIQERLQALDNGQPYARKAVRQIELILQSLAAVTETSTPGSPDASQEVPRSGLLPMPSRSRVIINQVAGHGIALDHALNNLLQKRRQAIAGQATWIVGSFAGAALLFAALCLVAFGFIHRRIGGPVQALAYTVGRIHAGDWSARAKVTGTDELAELASAFNGMLDRQQSVEARLQEQQAELEDQRQMLLESQRIAHIGSWRLDVPTGTLEWSPETYRIVGVDPETFTPIQEAFFACVHPNDRARLLTQAELAISARQRHDIEFRLIRPDGEVRHVHERAEAELDESGQVRVVAGTIQDITERKQLDERLRQYRQLVEGSADQCAVIDTHYRYRLINQAYADMNALDREQVEGAYVWEVLGEADFRRLSKPGLDRCLAGEAQVREVERHYPDQGTRNLLVRYYPIAPSEEDDRLVGVIVTDITALKQAKAELREQERLLDIAGRVARFGGWAVDLRSDRVIWSDMVAEIYGMPPGYAPTFEEAIGFCAPEYRERIRNLFDACVEAGEPFDQELQVITAQSERVWVRSAAVPVMNEQGNIVRVQGAFQDITQHKLTEEELRRRTRDLGERVKELMCIQRVTEILDAGERSLAELLEEVVAVIPAGWQYPEITVAAIGIDGDHFTTPGYRLTPWAQTEPIRVHGDAMGTVTVCYLDQCPDADEGVFLHEERNLIRLIADKLGHVVERRRIQHELRRVAYEDTLTGLPSRNGFIRALSARLESTGWQTGAMVVMLDIEAQRDVNDAYGYAAGDDLLRQVGQRLGGSADDQAVVGRIGGDEFAVFLPERPDRTPKQQRQALTAAFEVPVQLDDFLVDASACFGYTMLGYTPRSPESLLREAELALFHNRRHSIADNWAAYTSELDEATQRRIEVTRGLRRALAESQFQLHFQPKVDLSSGGVIGGEALLRWFDPENGLQSPTTFIPIAEQSQLIGPIGDWVINDACRCLREWQDSGLEVVRIAVNVSRVQFTMGGFTDTVREVLAAHGVVPEALTLEITESVFEHESETLRQQLRELHDMGVRLALDDFGTGYSSLLYLQQYPFDEIKIDQGFVRRMLDDPYSHNVVSTVVAIAGALGADAVAEGVENEVARDALLAMGCRLGQGFHYSAPVAAEAFRRLLETRDPLPTTSVGEQ